MLRDTFTKYILKTLYLTLVYPYLNYCNLIWGSAYTSTLIPLVILQKKCICLICNADFLAHTNPLFKSTKLLKLNQIHEINCAIFLYKCFHYKTYYNFKMTMITNSQIHPYYTRRRNDLRTPFQRLQLGVNSFITTGIIIWNKIPISIKHANSIFYFKSKMKNMLINSTSEQSVL